MSWGESTRRGSSNLFGRDLLEQGQEPDVEGLEYLAELDGIRDAGVS